MVLLYHYLFTTYITRILNSRRTKFVVDDTEYLHNRGCKTIMPRRAEIRENDVLATWRPTDDSADLCEGSLAKVFNENL